MKSVIPIASPALYETETPRRAAVSILGLFSGSMPAPVGR
jgi:hypothetical protein